MKKHFQAIITKFLFVAPILGFIGPIFSHMTYTEALLTAIIITLAAYLSADLVLLPQYGNITALTGDAVITMAVFWEMSSIFSRAHVNFPGIFLAAALIVFGEWYLHPYLLRTVLQKPRSKPARATVPVKKQSKKSPSNKKSKHRK